MTGEAALVARLQAALNARDSDAAAGLMHPRAAFADYLAGGEVSGPVAVRDFFVRLFASLAPDFDLLGLEILADGRAAAEHQVCVRGADGALWSDTRVTITYVIADGLIIGLELTPVP